MTRKEIENNKAEAIKATAEAFAREMRELEEAGIGFWLIKDTAKEYMNAIERIIND